LPHRVAAGRPAIRARGINRSADPAKAFTTWMWHPRRMSDMAGTSTPYEAMINSRSIGSEESPEPQAGGAARQAEKALVAAEG